MKNIYSNIALTSILLTSALASLNTLAADGLSANAAVVSQYFFRGIAQTGTASASAGVDYTKENLSVGIWSADVQDGIEIDIYGSYSFNLAELGLSAGYTSYQYTGDFDTAYNEVNLAASYKFISVSYNIGTHDVNGASDEDYDFLSVTAEYKSFYATYGSWGKDFDGDYIEVGYSTNLSGFDLGVALIVNDKELDLETGKGDETLVFSLKKSF